MSGVAASVSNAVVARTLAHDAVPAGRCSRGSTGSARQAGATDRARRPLLAGAGMLVLLTACGEENRFIAPPPPKVTVEFPVQQTVTPYLEATGNAASVNNIKLVARVQGYVQEIKYQDGQAVKKGTPLFVIEPEPYKVQLEQAQAAKEGAKATLVNAEAEFTRQQELQSKDVSTQANLDKARANRDTARANVLQAQANTQNAEITLGYTTVSAPLTASSPRARSRSASWSAAATRASSRPSSRSTRSGSRSI